MLGAKAITSLEDDADEARVMKGFYPLARDGLLEEAEWSFAIRQFQPAQSAADPLWGWGAAFPLPSDILRLLQVDNNKAGIRFNDMQRSQVPHEVYDRVIYCNEKAIFCTGIRRVEDEGIYSPLFVEAFASKLAVLAALPITESNTKLQEMMAIHQSFMKTAKSRDGMQSTSRPIRNRTFIGVR